MHCCHNCLMLWGPPTLKANLAGVCDQLFCSIASLAVPVSPLPASWLSPSARLCRRPLCVSLRGCDREMQTTQRGRWCLVATGDNAGVTLCSLMTFPGGANLDSPASSCLVTSYPWTVFWV